MAKRQAEQKPAKTAVRDPEGTKSAILAAATREFMEKGFGGARIDAIAAHARINKRMLYHYYGGKEALYLAVLEETYASIRLAEAKLDLLHREPAEGLRELVQFTFRYFLEHPEFISLLGTENLLQAKFLKTSERIVAMNSPLIDELRGVLERGAKAGVFRKNADPLDVYITMAALSFFPLSNRWTLSTVFGRDVGSKKEGDRWAEHISDVLLRSLKP